jgi:hypothetical protein
MDFMGDVSSRVCEREFCKLKFRSQLRSPLSQDWKRLKIEMKCANWHQPIRGGGVDFDIILVPKYKLQSPTRCATNATKTR